MDALEYWKETLLESCEENGVPITAEQATAVARDLCISHENYGLAFYQPTGNPLRDEIESLKKLLEEERAKRVCPKCIGKGVLVDHGPVHSAISRCHKCKGEGKVKP